MAVELDVCALAGDANVLARYGAHLLQGVHRLQKYVATRGDLLLPEQQDVSGGLPEADVHVMDGVLEVLGVLATVAGRHNVGVVLASDVRGLEESVAASAKLAVAALAGVMARVYGQSISVFVNVTGTQDLERLSLLAGTMFAMGNGGEADPAVFLSSGCGEDPDMWSKNDGIGLLGVECTGVESLRSRLTSSFRVVYSEGVADMQVARLRALKHVPLVRREVVAGSLEDENRVICDWTASEDSRRALTLERNALWKVARNKILVGRD